jgi:predicted dehydrogenase
MTTPIRWGILSTGRIAATFVEDLRLLPDAVVTAVGSRTEGAAKRFAAAHGIPTAHGSWRALAEDPDVDVVYVATPHSGHLAATMTVLDAGKAALTEKPIALDVAQATDLFDAARERGLFLMEAMWTRFIPAVRRATELVASGAIGRVSSVSADFGFVAPDDETHRLHAKALGGGALLDVGIYPATMAHLFLGAPDEIRAWADIGPQGTDRNTAMIFGYASGALASLTCSLVAATPWLVVIAGTEGRIDLPSVTSPAHLTLHRDDRAAELVDLSYAGRGYHFEAAHVHTCLRDGLIESPVMPHAESLAVMTTLDRVRAQIGVTY